MKLIKPGAAHVLIGTALVVVVSLNEETDRGAKIRWSYLTLQQGR